MGYDLRDELVAGVGLGRAVRPGDVVDEAVAHVLQRPGHARRAVVLDHRQEDQLVHPPRDDQAEVRAEVAVVLGVVPLVDEVHLHELVGIVAGDRVVAGEGHLELGLVVAAGGEAAPTDAFGEDLGDLRGDQFVLVAVEDEDVPRLHAGRLQPLDHLEDQLVRRVGIRIPVGHDLDADDVAGFEERSPAFGPVVGAGQFLHAPGERGLDGVAALDAAPDHPLVAGLDDAAGIGAGDAEGPPGGLAGAGGLGLVGRGTRRGSGPPRSQRRGRGQEAATAQAAAGSSGGRGHRSSLLGAGWSIAPL